MTTIQRPTRLAAMLVLCLATVQAGSASASGVHHLYIGVQSGVEVFRADDRGNVTPDRELLFPPYFSSHENAVDAKGELIACGGYPFETPYIAIYAPHASGMANPIRVIGGPDTTMVFPQGIAVDDVGNIYVDDERLRQIDVFAAGASGDVAPVRVIAGPHTLLNKDNGALAGDHAGDIFIQQGGIFLDGTRSERYRDDRLLEFGPGASGDVAPIAA